MNEKEMLRINKEGWDKVADQFFEGAFDILDYGPYTPSENELQLFGEIENLTILEIGCGSGHTLQYLARNGAQELWGVDISSVQIQTAKKVVAGMDIPITFVETPMEDMDRLPDNYFDKALSIYALGWTVNLHKTLTSIHRSLKPGGSFVFSWEHPFHSVLEYKEKRLRLWKSYVKEGYIQHDSWRGVPIIMNHRKMSTFINLLIEAGFVIDRIVEQSLVKEGDVSKPDKWYSGVKARLVPSTFVIKSHKA